MSAADVVNLSVDRAKVAFAGTNKDLSFPEFLRQCEARDLEAIKLRYDSQKFQATFCGVVLGVICTLLVRAPAAMPIWHLYWAAGTAVLSIALYLRLMDWTLKWVNDVQSNSIFKWAYWKADFDVANRVMGYLALLLLKCALILVVLHVLLCVDAPPKNPPVQQQQPIQQLKELQE